MIINMTIDDKLIKLNYYFEDILKYVDHIIWSDIPIDFRYPTMIVSSLVDLVDLNIRSIGGIHFIFEKKFEL